MNKRFTTILIVAASLIPVFAFSQTAPSLSPFKYLGSSNTITPLVSSSSLTIPSLGSTGSPCVIVSNSSGLFATSTCAAGGSGITAIGTSTATSTFRTQVVGTNATITIPSNVGFFTNDSGYSTTTPANPTAQVGTAAVNGSASTFMRSDAAPAINTGISPTWTGQHTFQATTTMATTTLTSTTVSQLTNTGITSALALINASHVETAYGGASACSSGNFVTTISAVGGTTCAALAAANFANPTAQIGTAAVNGSATTAMRSDAAPAINQAATFSFSALGNTTSTGNIAASTINASTSITNGGVKSALVLDNSSGLETAYGGASGCASSTPFISAISAVGASTCSGNASSSIPFVIEFPTASENDAIYIFNSTSTVKTCLAVNKTAGDTVTFNLGYSSSRATATSSLNKLFSSDQTITATTTPTTITINGSTTPGTANPLILYTTAASSTQFTVTCYYTTP